MKIILATPLFPPEIGDVATYVKDVLGYLRLNNQVQILTYAGVVEDTGGLEIFTVEKRQFIFFRIWQYFIKLLKLAKEADLIYVQNSVAVSLPAVLVKRITGKKVIINFIEDEAWKRAKRNNLTTKSWQAWLEKPKLNFKINLIRKLQTWTLRQADQVIASSKVLAQALSRGYNLAESKLVVNYPAATSPIILPFEQKIKNNQVLIFGQGLDFPRQEEIKDLNLIALSDKSLSKAEISYLINTSELIIYNVRSENFTNLLIDCVARGKNIVAHDTSYAQEIMGSVGVFVDFSNRQAMFKKIQYLLDGGEGNNAIKSIFTWENHLSKLEEIFEIQSNK